MNKASGGFYEPVPPARQRKNAVRCTGKDGCNLFCEKTAERHEGMHPCFYAVFARAGGPYSGQTAGHTIDKQMNKLYFISMQD